MKEQLRILLVEDDPDDVELFGEAFRGRTDDGSLHVITEGDKVIPHLLDARPHPDVIILDLNLPKMDGKEILKVLKESKDFSHLPVVILTTSASPADREFCLTNGAHEFMTKPTTMDGIDRMMNVILNVAGGGAR